MDSIITVDADSTKDSMNQEAIIGLNRKKTGFDKFIHENGVGYLFLSPFIILFCIFVLVPILVAIFFSLTNYNMIQPFTWNGITNYRRLFLDDNIFLTSLRNTFIFAVFIGPIGYIMSFMMAWILNSIKFRRLFALAFYAPSITSGIAMATVWLTIFSNDRMGYINNFLLNIGIISEPILWNQSADHLFPAIILISVWMSLGTGFLVFLAGLQNLPQEVFESGKIDGIKSRWQELYYLIFPLMKPQLLFGAINSIVASFGIFEIVYQFAGMPTPNYSAHTIVAHLYDYAFLRFQMGYSSAIAVVLFAITFSLGRICMRIFRTND